MSLSFNPAPVAFLDMVLPTWHLPEYWADGRAEPLLRSSRFPVSTHQVNLDGNNHRLRLAHPWHLFPTTQPPESFPTRSFLALLVPVGRCASSALDFPRSFTRSYEFSLYFLPPVTFDSSAAPSRSLVLLRRSARDLLADHCALVVRVVLSSLVAPRTVVDSQLLTARLSPTIAIPSLTASHSFHDCQSLNDRQPSPASSPLAASRPLAASQLQTRQPFNVSPPFNASQPFNASPPFNASQPFNFSQRQWFDSFILLFLRPPTVMERVLARIEIAYVFCYASVLAACDYVLAAPTAIVGYSGTRISAPTSDPDLTTDIDLKYPGIPSSSSSSPSYPPSHYDVAAVAYLPGEKLFIDFFASKLPSSVVNSSYPFDHQTSAALSLVALAALVALEEHEHYSYYNLPIFNLSLSLLTLVLITPSACTYAKTVHTKIASMQSHFAMTNLAFLLTLMCLILPTANAMPVNTRGGGAGGGSASDGVPISRPNIPIGSGSYPNMIKDWDFLPGMKRWNGQPFYDFAGVWWVALVVALGTIVQDGNTLLTCAEGTDEGCNAADPPDKVRQHNSRNSRLFACILNYINPTSRVYRIALSEFANDGHGLFIWLKEYGKLEHDDTTRRELLNEWDDATMARVGITFTPNAIWEWLEYVETLGDQLGKSISQRRKKILAGFPESFDVLTSPERLKPDPGSYVIPAVYPNHHPKKGEPHPDAGKADLYELCKAFYPEWHHRIKIGQIKSVPRGSVYKVDDANADASDKDDEDNSDDDVLYASTTRKQITSRSVCSICGGRGHYGRVDGMDCLTKQLGINIPRSELALTQYPSGITYPFTSSFNSSSASKNKSTQSANSTSSMRRHGKSKAAGKSSIKPNKPPFRTQPKHVKRIDDNSEHTDHEEYTEQEDDKSSDKDPHVDFTALAINYHIIDTQHNTYYSSDSSDDTSIHHPRPRK